MFFFVLVVFLQQVAGYGALEAGAATSPTTVVLFLFSRRFGALADRLGPRLFMAVGPLVSAGGVMSLPATIDESPGFLVDILPGTTIFALGLATLVSPLTAAVLADAEERNAGIAPGVNNAVARVAGLLATAAVGTIAGGTLDLGGFRMALAGAAGPARTRWRHRSVRDPQPAPAARGRARPSASRMTARSATHGESFPFVA